jgi:hypothetical protein
MKHTLALVLMVFGSFGAFANIDVFKKVPEINEYFCEFENFSFNLNWDENVYNTKAIITIDAFDDFKFDASDKLLGQFGLGEIIFRRLNNQLERYDFYFSEGAFHEGDFIRGFFISGVDRQQISTLYVETFGEGEARFASTNLSEVNKGNCKFLKVHKE